MAKTARRSIDALFAPSQPTGVEDMDNARTIAVDLLESNPYQPRKTFDEAALAELANDIKVHGVLQPLLVRPHPMGKGRYQIAAGERRWRAAKQAGMTDVPCIERDMDDGAMERLALVENVQRTDLDPVDEAHAYKRLMERLELSQRELAETIHKDQSYIVLRLRLIEHPRIEAVVRAGKMSPTVGQEVARVADSEQRTKIIDQAERGERVRVQDVKAVRDAAMTKQHPAVTPDVEASTSLSVASVMNNSSVAYEEKPVRATDTREGQGATRQTTPRVVPVDGLGAVLRALDADVVDALLGFGVERAWSCQELLRAIREWRV